MRGTYSLVIASLLFLFHFNHVIIEENPLVHDVLPLEYHSSVTTNRNCRVSSSHEHQFCSKVNKEQLVVLLVTINYALHRNLRYA